MSNYFNPEDVIIKEGVVSNITRNGAGFVSTKDGSDVFVPIRLVQTSGIEMGDSVTVYMVKNFGDASLKNISDSATYRALRVVVNNRLGVGASQELAASVVLPTYSAPIAAPVLPEAFLAKPKPTASELCALVEKYILAGFIGTAAMLHSEFVKDMTNLDMMGDDFGARMKIDISNILQRLHADNDIAKASICSSGDQKHSSYSVYGSSAKGLFNAIIGA